MNLLRLILVALAVWIVIVLVRSAQARRKVSRQRPANRVEDMVSCAQCGLHLPEKEALREGERYFCCVEHRDSAKP